MENKDKYIVDRIRNYREEVDMNALWDQVSPHIPKPKKKRRIAFWIFGGAVLFVLSGLFLLNVHTQNTDNRIFDGNEYASNSKDSSISPKEEKIGLLSSDSPKEAAQPFQIQTNPDKNIKGENLKPELIKDDKIEVITSFNLSESINNNQPSIVNELRDVKQEKNHKDALLTQIGYPDQEDGAFIQNRNEDEMPTRTTREVVSLDKLSSDLTFIIQRDLGELRLDKQVDVLKGTKANFRIWDFYFMSGGSLVNQTLKALSADITAEAERIESITEVMGSWQLEAGIGFKISPKIKLSFGLGYLQIHEKASFETEYLVDNVIETNNFINRQDGTVENDFSTKIVSGTRYTNEQRFNELKIISIPIRLSYRLLNIDVFQIDVEGASSLAFHQSYEGFTSFSGSTSSYDLNLDEESRFRTRGALKLGLGLKGAMHLNRRTDLNLRIGIEQLRNITTTEYLIDQKYTFYTLSCGISHRL